MPDKEQSPSVTVLSSVCGVHFREECRGCISAKESNDERIEALHAEREKLREWMRLIEFDATNKNSAPSARLQRIADYARAALSGKGSPDAP